MDRPVLDPSAVKEWLARRHGAEIAALEVLPSGYWSAAFGYAVGGRELVLRVGTQLEGFAMDRLAYQFTRPGLPIPEVLEVGERLASPTPFRPALTGVFWSRSNPARQRRLVPSCSVCSML